MSLSLSEFHPVSLTSVLLTKFIESIPDSQLVRQKLGCMCKMVESDLFKQSGTVAPLWLKHNFRMISI